MATTKGGKQKSVTNLQLRRKLWDATSESSKSSTKRPGSNKK